MVSLEEEEIRAQADSEKGPLGEDSHLQAKEISLRRNQLCSHLDLQLLASRTVGK